MEGRGDAGLDLVSAVLRGTEHGDVALARWEEDAGALIDGVRLARRRPVS